MKHIRGKRSDNSDVAAAASHIVLLLIITSMTREQMREAVGDMIESGQMTVDQSSCLVGMLGSSALMSVSGTSDPAYDASSVNFISQLQDAVAGAQWRHDGASVMHYSQALQVLQKYQEVGSST